MSAQAQVINFVTYVTATYTDMHHVHYTSSEKGLPTCRKFHSKNYLRQASLSTDSGPDLFFSSWHIHFFSVTVSTVEHYFSQEDAVFHANEGPIFDGLISGSMALSWVFRKVVFRQAAASGLQRQLVMVFMVEARPASSMKNIHFHVRQPDAALTLVFDMLPK